MQKNSNQTLLAEEIEALPGSLPHLVEKVIPKIAELGWSPADLNRIELVLEEAMLNVALHGYAGSGGWLKIELESLNEGDLRLELQDRAPRFDPLAMPEPDCSLAIEERNIGGLGVHLVRNMSDEISYSYKEGRNILRITFRPRA